MKRIITTAGALALAGGLWFIGADAQARPACGEGDTVDQDIVIGSVCAGGSTGGQGHIYADGNADNPEPLDGYIGANNDEGAENSGIVGCASGDYQDDTEPDGDADPNVIWNPGPTPPPSPNPNSPCTPRPG